MFRDFARSFACVHGYFVAVHRVSSGPACRFGSRGRSRRLRAFCNSQIFMLAAIRTEPVRSAVRFRRRQFVHQPLGIIMPVLARFQNKLGGRSQNHGVEIGVAAAQCGKHNDVFARLEHYSRQNVRHFVTEPAVVCRERLGRYRYFFAVYGKREYFGKIFYVFIARESETQVRRRFFIRSVIRLKRESTAFRIIRGDPFADSRTLDLDTYRPAFVLVTDVLKAFSLELFRLENVVVYIAYDVYRISRFDFGIYYERYRDGNFARFPFGIRAILLLRSLLPQTLRNRFWQAP